MAASDAGCCTACARVTHGLLQVLRILGFTLDRTKGHDILVLIANVVVYRAAFFFLLKAREAFAK